MSFFSLVSWEMLHLFHHVLPKAIIHNPLPCHYLALRLCSRSSAISCICTTPLLPTSLLPQLIITLESQWSDTNTLVRYNVKTTYKGTLSNGKLTQIIWNLLPKTTSRDGQLTNVHKDY